MPHGQEGGGVGALPHRHPEIGELHVLGVVRRHGYDLGSLVTGLDGEVRVRCARHRQIGAGDDEIGRVVPVGRFRHVGLLAPGLWAGSRQVAVPVVEGTAGRADQAEVTRSGRIGDHRHGRDRRETIDAVRAPFVYGVNVGGGDDFGDFFPVGAHKAAQAAHAGVFQSLCRIGLDRGPSLHRVFPDFSLGAVEIEQAASDHRVLDAVR